MAQYYTDFSEYEIGLPPTDWTPRWRPAIDYLVVEDSLAHNGVAFRIGPGPAAITNELYSWDAIAPNADFEVLYRWRATSSHASGFNGGVAGRASGAYADATGYAAGSLFTNFARRRVARLDSGTITLKQEVTSLAMAGIDVYKFSRFRVQENNLQFRAWPGELADEPAAWQIDLTDDQYTDAGWIGAYRSFNNQYVYYDFFAVGTGGDPAPIAPLSGSFRLYNPFRCHAFHSYRIGGAV